MRLGLPFDITLMDLGVFAPLVVVLPGYGGLGLGIVFEGNGAHGHALKRDRDWSAQRTDVGSIFAPDPRVSWITDYFCSGVVNAAEHAHSGEESKGGRVGGFPEYVCPV